MIMGRIALFFLVSLSFSTADAARRLDVTGRWDAATYDRANSPRDCDFNQRNFVVEIYQFGNKVDIKVGGLNTRGRARGRRYTFNTAFKSSGGKTKIWGGVTFSSNSAGRGNYNWTWNDGRHYCKGHGKVRLKRSRVNFVPR